jgi:hypothetical protein
MLHIPIHKIQKKGFSMRQLIHTATDGLVYGFAFAIGWFAAVLLLGIVVVV